METHVYSLQIRALIYREGREFVARALEMDLLGYGKSPKAAVEELKQAVEAQITFARQMNDLSLLQFPADQEYFQRWEEAQRKALRSEILGDKSVKLSARAVFLSFTPAELKTLRTRRFSQTALACA